ncbi:MAG: hypothetical protein VX953_04125 [Pseudomonadota bacterium]|nr:hypothetical protein [Pseudomonadota bacterium]MEE2816904.1 hypothetical protein [Pseudomonadota bacterium]
MVDKTDRHAPGQPGGQADAEQSRGADDLFADTLMDDLFAEARDCRPAEVPVHLEQSIIREAVAIQAARAAAVQAQGADWAKGRTERGRTGLMAQLRGVIAAIGGWPAVGGLATASAAGLWIGLAPPSFIPDPVALAGIDLSASDLPDDSYDLALVLSEETE